MTQNSVDKEKGERRKSTLLIFVRAQMFTNNDRLLQNSPSLHNLKSGLPIKAVFHFRYIISLFIQQPCQIIARKIEISSILLVNQKFYLFIY